MNRVKVLILTIGVVFALAGCAQRCHVKTNAYSGTNEKKDIFKVGDSFAVLEGEEKANILLDKEVKSKIEHILKKRGYLVEVPEKADYFITYGYSIDSGSNTTISGTRAIYTPGQTTYHSGSVNAYGSGGYGYGNYSGTSTTQGTTSYVPTSTTVTLYSRTFNMRVYDAKNFRNNNKEEIVWAGDSTSRGTISDLRQIVTYLLQGTFKYFGQDTGMAITNTLSIGNKEAKEIDERIL